MFAATLQQLCRAFVLVKRIDAGHIQIGQPLVLNQQKQESLTCFIRFYLTVHELPVGAFLYGQLLYSLRNF